MSAESISRMTPAEPILDCYYLRLTYPIMSDTEALTVPRLRVNLGAGARNAWAPMRPARRQKAVFILEGVAVEDRAGTEGAGSVGRWGQSIDARRVGLDPSCFLLAAARSAAPGREPRSIPRGRDAASLQPPPLQPQCPNRSIQHALGTGLRL